MKKIKVTNKNHPHFGEQGIVIKEDVPLSLSFLGVMDRIKNENGEEFFCKKSDYKLVS